MQNQITVENKHEWQDGRSDIVHKSLQTGGNGRRFGNGRRRISSQPDRRRIVGQDSEVETEQVGGHQRHDKVHIPADFNDHRGRQRSHHDIGGRCRQPHADD